MAPAALDAYGWRIAFLLGAATLPFGLSIRRSLPETLDIPEPEAPASIAPTRLAAVRASSRIIGLAFVVLAAGTIGTYVFNYITTYAEDTLHMPPTVSFLADALGNGAAIPAVLIGGWLSDKIGRRRPLLIWPNLLNLILILPAFMWVIATRSSVALLVTAIGLGFLGSLPTGVFFAALAETLPKRIRGGAFGTVYAFAIAIFGGTTQLVVTWLIHATGNPMSPAWYLLGASAIGQVALMLILESAPAKPRAAA
jgi:MFS family permease